MPILNNNSRQGSVIMRLMPRDTSASVVGTEYTDSDNTSRWADIVEDEDNGSSSTNLESLTSNVDKTTLQDDMNGYSHVRGSRTIDVLRGFKEKSRDGEWPFSTNIACHWCCHNFEGFPIGIPHRYNTTTKQFHVTGCFCSVNCAAAFNFQGVGCSLDEMWDRYSLINMLARHIRREYIGEDPANLQRNNILAPVIPAPDRTVLAMFGGTLDIETFRTSQSSIGAGGIFEGTVLKVNPPPMVASTYQFEDINLSDLSVPSTYIPLDTQRVSQYREKVILSRTKPLHAPGNTLDNTMNIRIERR